LTSDEINEAIYKMDYRVGDNTLYKSCIGGKVIPYIGWFWREVYFDADHCWLGIIPEFDNGHERIYKPRVGFMQNNKWGYDEFKVKGAQWGTLRKLIVTALKEMTVDSFERVDSYMQSLLPNEYK